MSVADEPVANGAPTDVQRRAPYAANPAVGARGRRARQRILDAALEVFAEVGYHRCGISRITKVAGCSRASFYQYFSSKEEVFRVLAGQVSLQLAASAEGLEPITPDLAGWTSLQAWIDRHHVIYARYEPVFRVFQSAADSDAAVASGTADIRSRDVATVQAKLVSTSLPDRHVGDVVALLLNVMSWVPRLAQVLQVALPPASLPRDRIAAALADVAHRTMFGIQAGVNVRPEPTQGLPRVQDRAALLEHLRIDCAPNEVEPARTLKLLVDTARKVLVRRGYHEMRVDDIMEAAGLAHGVFYRYFDSKDHIVRFVAFLALQEVFGAFDDIPDAGVQARPDGVALRLWLDRYRATQAQQAALIRAWLEATGDDPVLGAETAAALDLGCERLVRFLAPRGFGGDVEADALLMITLLDAVGGVYSVPGDIEPAALMVERGLLGAQLDPESNRRRRTRPAT
jgi:AcrR family transcriptional regulator